MLAASMLVIGDEILSGHVTDANSPWLAGRLHDLGVPLDRVHVVPDDHAAIDQALRAELARSAPRVILTSGGIGSTPDDITYEAVAASLGRELVEDPTIAARLDGAVAWSQQQGLDVTDEFTWHLHRMARLPAGARLLLREGGWVAGVAVDVDGGSDDDGATIVILPGVPAEFRALVEAVVEPQLLAGRNEVPVTTEIEHGFPESALNTTFVAVLERHPDIKLGSYPGRPMLVRLTGPADAVAGAAEEVRAELTRLEASPGGRRLAAAWSARRGDDAAEERDA